MKYLYQTKHPTNICLLPCEDVSVLSQEMGKEAYEVFNKLRTDVGEVFRVVIQRYKLQLFRGLGSGVHLVAHVELVQVYVIDRFLLHGSRVTLPGTRWSPRTIPTPLAVGNLIIMC